MCLPKSEYSVFKNRRGNYHYNALRSSVDIFKILIFVRYFRTAIHCRRLLSPTILQQSKQYICNNGNTDTAILHKQKNKYLNIVEIQTMKKIQIYQFQISKIKHYNIREIKTLHLQRRKYKYRIPPYWRNLNNTFAMKKTYFFVLSYISFQLHGRNAWQLAIEEYIYLEWTSGFGRGPNYHSSAVSNL